MRMKYLLVVFVSALSFNILGAETSTNSLLLQKLYRLSDTQSMYLDDSDRFSISKKPAWSLAQGDGWNLLVRSSSRTSVSHSSALLGKSNDQLMTLFSPSSSKTLSWGAGSVFLRSTDENSILNNEAWGAGPTAAFVMRPGNWVLGSTVSNVWSFSDNQQDKLNQFSWQYLVNYKMQKGWYLTSAPTIRANWNADHGSQWTIPLGGGLGKVFRLGKQRFDGNVSAYYNVAKPDDVDDWQLRMQFRYLFPE